jgi:hypothetical protein
MVEFSGVWGLQSKINTLIIYTVVLAHSAVLESHKVNPAQRLNLLNKLHK